MTKLGIVSTAALSLILGIAGPLLAQEQHEEQKDAQEQQQKDKPAKAEEKHAQAEEKKAQEAKPSRQEEEKSAQEGKNVKQEEKTAQTEKNIKQEEKTTQRNEEQQAKAGRPEQRNHIPDDKYRAHFGREHTFRVTEGDYRNHRFLYGGYAFGFVDPWPANWLYTQNVYVVEIGGVYYLCNPVYPGVNLTLSFTL